MALVSMTGYGRGETVSNGMKLEVELSSVNRKQFDVRISLPSNLSGLDAKIKKQLHSSISRGSVTGSIRIGAPKQGKGKKVAINTENAEKLLKELRKVGRHLKLKDDVTLSDLMKVTDVIKPSEDVKSADEVWPLLKKSLDKALLAMVKMRKTEGSELEKDIRKRLVVLEKYAAVITKQVPLVEKRFKRRISKKLRDAGVKNVSADEKLQRELLFFVDKTDISEEVVRLASHFKHAKKMMTTKAPVGRSLDFLCQEMFREINTIGSKANDALISKEVV